ncbi:MAG: hypothetical protein KDE55_07325 [Novosphingobium sp.]|nr:hypothetical protein [Novosphingobium sp.]
MVRNTAILSALLLAACHSGGTSNGAHAPGDMADHRPFEGVAAADILHMTGTEPFWGGMVDGKTFTYTTPENPDGLAIAVERFGGRGGLGLSGSFDGRQVDMAVTPGDCSDGMSDRAYPFVVTLRIGGETRQGCAWSDSQPFSGPEQP